MTVCVIIGQVYIMIVFGKLTKEIYSSGEFYVYQFTLAGGEKLTAVYYGDNPPIPRKARQYQLTGVWAKYNNRKQFEIESFKVSTVTTVNYKVELK